MEDELVRCVSCGCLKARSAYRPRREKTNGLTSMCRACLNNNSAAYDVRRRANDPWGVWVNRVLAKAKIRAREKGVPFALGRADIQTTGTCPVLGIRLEPCAGSNNPASPTLDRIVPILGYVPGNVRVISKRANLLKNDGTTRERMALLQYDVDQMPALSSLLWDELRRSGGPLVSPLGTEYGERLDLLQHGFTPTCRAV